MPVEDAFVFEHILEGFRIERLLYFGHFPPADKSRLSSTGTLRVKKSKSECLDRGESASSVQFVRTPHHSPQQGAVKRGNSPRYFYRIECSRQKTIYASNHILNRISDMSRKVKIWSLTRLATAGKVWEEKE